MQNSEEKIVFKKRFDIWRSEREHILKESRRMQDQNNDQKLNKYIKKINEINPNILVSLKKDFSLSQYEHELDIDFASSFKDLVFNFDNFDKDVYDYIQKEANEVNEIERVNFIMTDNDELNDGLIVNVKENKLLLSKIKQEINEVSNDIQKFPEIAKSDLQSLNNSLKIAREVVSSNGHIIDDSNLVDISKIKKSKNLKIPFFVNFWLLISFFIIIVIMVVLILVL